MNTGLETAFGAIRSPRGLAWGAVLIVPVLLLLPVGGPTSGHWAAGFWDLLHLPAFYALTRSLRLLVGVAGDSRGRHLLAVGLAILFAFGSEIAQASVGRSSSVHDLVLDAFGIALGAIAPVRSPGWSLLRKAGFALLLLSGVAFAFGPALLSERAERRAKERLPVIGAFEDRDSLRLWRSQGPAVATSDPSKGGLLVSLRPGSFGGVRFSPGEQDWSGYSELWLRVSNPGPSLSLGIRIDDRLSSKDRVWYTSSATVAEGDSEIVIPLGKGAAKRGGRALDLSQTARLVLFVEKVEKPVEFSIISAGLR